MTTWSKNEVTALKRQCTLLVYKDGALCPRGEDLMATGFVYFRGANSPNVDPAVGTMTNQRRGLVVADKNIEAVDTAADTLTFTAHGLETGDGPFNFGTTSALPGGLSAFATPYWLIKVDADKVKVATSLANAYAGTAVDLTSSGSGTNTMSDTATTTRGIDGRFVYQATQTETNHDGVESEVFVDSGSSGSFALKDGNGGGAVVSMASAVKGFETVFEGGYDGLQIATLWTSVLAGPVLDFSTGVLAFKSLDGTKTRLTVTTGPTGRPVFSSYLPEIGAEKEKNGPFPSTLARSYAWLVSFASKL